MKALRLYASYLIEILNDKDHGNEQLARVREIGQARGGNQFDMNNMNADGIEGSSEMGSQSQDGSPVVFISGEPEKLGQITNCNMSMCKVFGYTKKDGLVGHEVDILMPKLYSKNHRKFLEGAVQKPLDMLSGKDRLVFGKHFAGYIFPVWFSVRNVASFVNGR